MGERAFSSLAVCVTCSSQMPFMILYLNACLHFGRVSVAQNQSCLGQERNLGGRDSGFGREGSFELFALRDTHCARCLGHVRQQRRMQAASERALHRHADVACRINCIVHTTLSTRLERRREERKGRGKGEGGKAERGREREEVDRQIENREIERSKETEKKKQRDRERERERALGDGDGKRS